MNEDIFCVRTLLIDKQGSNLKYIPLRNINIADVVAAIKKAA
jgi:hypothetical protein